MASLRLSFDSNLLPALSRHRRSHSINVQLLVGYSHRCSQTPTQSNALEAALIVTEINRPKAYVVHHGHTRALVISLVGWLKHTFSILLLWCVEYNIFPPISASKSSWVQKSIYFFSEAEAEHIVSLLRFT